MIKSFAEMNKAELQGNRVCFRNGEEMEGKIRVGSYDNSTLNNRKLWELR